MPHDLHASSVGTPRAEELVELASRWRRARLGALGGAAGATETEEEEELLRRLSPEPRAREAALRRSFEHSLRLGEGFARFRGAKVDPEALPEVLPALSLPCLQGRWESLAAEPALRLERAPCRPDANVSRCDHAREAIDGLVMGMTGGVRHARHESAGHGGARCVDVFFAEPLSALRYGPVPPALAPLLEQVQAKVARFKRGASLQILGVTEGELHYQLHAPGASKSGCGGCGDLLPRFVEASLRSQLPTLVPRELSARPVLDRDETSLPPPPPDERQHSHA